MMHFLKLSCLLSLLIFAVSASAKSWQNVIPLQTTRAEILNLLGNPKINLKDKSEYFVLDNQTITFRWMRANCSAEAAIIDEKLIKPNSLVYQITVVPDTPLQSISSYTFDEPKIASSVPGFYWIPYITNCISNQSGEFSCSSVSGEYGFGYSKSNRGFTALYFVPTWKEEKIWKDKHLPCLSVENKE
jgi:hypothetical protein